MYMNYAEIGRRIAQKRRRMLLTQAEVEMKAKLSPRYLSNIERGRSIPSIDVLMQIANVLHMTPDEVLLGADTASQTQLSEEQLQKQLEADIRRLDPRQQEQAMSFIGWLKGQKSGS
ncbi:MAG: helix-turn-helix domain-containing protein [Lachnospiraceae bacterium]|nr:helix-turn-helix domain-containing protein [Lachnospiraceae bacterium]